MRCFTVTERSVFPGVEYTRRAAKDLAVVLGEAGRGRRQTSVPVGCQLAELAAAGQWEKIEEAAILETATGRLILVETRNVKDPRVIVRVSVRGGFRGSSVLCNPTPYLCPRVGENTDYGIRCSCGFTAEGHDEIHPAWQPGVVLWVGFMPALPRNAEFLPGVTIVAVGWFADGEAGREGGPHYDFLTIMEPNSALRIQRTGRLYGAPEDVIVRINKQPEIVYPEDLAAEKAGREESGKRL